MPVVEVDPDELRQFSGVPEKSEDELVGDLFSLGLELEGRTPDGALELELAPDRLDQLSVEGLARSLRSYYGQSRGLELPDLNRSHWTIEVAESVPAERPHVTGAIARDVTLNERTLASLIQLQEKLHETMGRGRRKAAIGLHDLTMLQGRRADAEAGDASITYRGIDRTGDTFVPLEADRELTPADVLAEHPTGQTYADVVASYDRMPAIYDEIGLFSFPPVINSQRTEVTAETRDLLIELTGTNQWTIDKMLAILCYALDLRGATLESVEVAYPDHAVQRPAFDPDRKRVAHDRIERTLGIDLDRAHVVDLFERSGMDATPVDADEAVTYEVTVPPYRIDIRHPVDLVDDVGRTYGFNELSPRYPDVATVGYRHERSRFERAVRSLLVGVGFEDLLNFNLISRERNFDRMQLAPNDETYGSGTPVEIAEPYSEAYEIVRTWALPSILHVLENNTHREYPQCLAEIGLAARVDRSRQTKVSERRSLAAAIAHRGAGYEEAKAKLTAVCRRLDVDVETPRREHPAFIDGRCASIDVGDGPVGVIGELHPAVLVEHGLELPVAAFELPLGALRDAKGVE